MGRFYCSNQVPQDGNNQMIRITAFSSKATDGSYHPTITVSGTTYYFMSPVGLPEHVHFTQQEANEYAARRLADLDAGSESLLSTIHGWLQGSGFITKAP